MDLTKERFSKYMDAGYPILLYKTYDELRALDMLAQLSGNHRILEWSALGVIDYESHTKKPYCALEEFLAEYLGWGPEELKSTILVIRDIRLYMDNPRVIGLLKQLAQYIITGDIEDCMVVLLGEDITIPVELETHITILEEERITDSEIELCLESFMENYDVFIDSKLKTRLITAFRGLSRYQIESILNLSYADGGEITDRDIDLVREQKQQIVKKSGVLEMIPLSESLESIGGLNSLKSWIEAKAQIFNALDEACEFGVDLPKGLLLAGIPGCGKSVSAKATAKLFNVPLLRLDMGRIMGKYVGESEENLRKAIRISENIAPCVLWIDEIEKAFSGVKGGSSTLDITNRLLASFLTWLQEKQSQVFVVMTANDITKLPTELLRKGRLDEIFFVDLPKAQERKQIFMIHINKRRPQDLGNIDLEQLVAKTEGYSGADIEGVVKEAVEYAFIHKKKMLTTELILQVINNTHSLQDVMSQSTKDMIKMYKDKKIRNASQE